MLIPQYTGIKLSGLPTDSYTSVVFDLNAPHIIYVASEHHGVYMSMNDGSSWVALNNGLPSGIIIHSLAFDFVEHLLWAATSHGYLSIRQWRSTMAGSE